MHTQGKLALADIIARCAGRVRVLRNRKAFLISRRVCLALLVLLDSAQVKWNHSSSLSDLESTRKMLSLQRHLRGDFFKTKAIYWGLVIALTSVAQ